MISEDEGDVIFRWPLAVLTDSELDGKSSRNSSRSTSFDHDSGGSEPDDVDLGPGDLSDDGSIAVGRVPVLAHHLRVGARVLVGTEDEVVAEDVAALWF